MEVEGDVNKLHIEERDNVIADSNEQILLDLNLEEDDVTSLKIPELIWQRALCNFPNETQQTILEYNFKFLNALMKNSKTLHNKRLKQTLIDAIQSLTSENSLVTQIEIINCKLEKYEEKDFFKKALEKYSKFIDTHLSESNFVLSRLIEALKNKISEFNLDSDKKDKINEYIIKSISNKINQNDLVENYVLRHNFIITEYIYEESYYTANKFKNDLKLDEIISNIVLKILENKNSNFDVTFTNEYFKMYWKYFSLNLRSDAETIMDNLCQIFMSNIANKKNKNTITKVFLNNLILLVQDELKIFTDKSLSLITKIIDIVKKLKILDLDLLKEIYMNLTETLYVNSFIYFFLDNCTE
jgi:hypothetical protein